MQNLPGILVEMANHFVKVPHVFEPSICSPFIGHDGTSTFDHLSDERNKGFGISLRNDLSLDHTTSFHSKTSLSVCGSISLSKTDRSPLQHV